MYKTKDTLLAICFTIAFIGNALAQDRLITTGGDTVYCKIENVDGEFLVFTVDGNTADKKKISFSMVKSYEKDHSPELVHDQQPHLTKVGKTKFPPLYQVNKGLMLGVAIGYSHRLANVPQGLQPELEKYLKRLKSGLAVKVDATYFFGRFFGLGAKYSLSYAANRMENVFIIDQFGQYHQGDMADRIAMHFVGVHLTSRVGPRSNNGHFLPGITVGYTAYVNKATLIDNFTLSSGSFSLAVNLATQFKIGRTTYLAFGADLITGVLNYINYKDATTSTKIDLEENNRDNIMRLDVSLGIRHYFTSSTRAYRPMDMPERFR